MSKIVKTRLCDIDISEFPLIILKVKKIDDLKEEDLESFFEKLERIINESNDSFVLFIDATEGFWMETKLRDSLGVRMSYLAEEYTSRYKKIYIYVPNVMIFVLRKLVSGFLKPIIPMKVSFNKRNLRIEAGKFVARLNGRNKFF